jgi:hypothetical protein
VRLAYHLGNATASNSVTRIVHKKNLLRGDGKVDTFCRLEMTFVFQNKIHVAWKAQHIVDVPARFV